MSTHWDGISTTRARKIEEVFLPYFTSPESGPFGKLVWESIMSIDCELPLFHERMLQAFLHFDPIPGTKEQVWRADAIKEVFQAKALSTSTASLDYALIEALFREIMVDPDMNQRLAASRMMFRSMERGLNRAKVLDIFRTFGYGKDYRIPHRPIYDDEFWQDHLDLIVEHWQEYPSDGLPQLFNFIYLASAGDSKRADRIIEIFGKGRSSGKYSREDITNALDYSANSPVGRIVLTRMLHIFAAEDVSAKLREIPRERVDTDTFEFLGKVGTLNLPRLVQLINNSIHTGYLDDLILARKVAQVMLQTRPYVEKPELREENKERLDEAFWDLVRPKEGVDPKRDEEEFLKRINDPDELLKFLELNEGPDWEVREALNPENQKLRIKFVPEAELKNQCVELGIEMGKALFRPAEDPQEIDEIWISKMPSSDRGTEEGQRALYNPRLARAKHLKHEITHWKTQSTHLQPMPLSREKRLAAEIMADMEDGGWEIRNFGTETYERAKRLGQPLGFYLRDNNDVGNFGKSNQSVIREIFGGEP